jgi:hypothetical protein
MFREILQSYNKKYKKMDTDNFIYYSLKFKTRKLIFLEYRCNSYFYIKCVKKVFFVNEKVFYAETKVEAV